MKLGVQQHRRQYLECDFLPLYIYLYIGHIWCGPGASAQYVPTAQYTPYIIRAIVVVSFWGPKTLTRGQKSTGKEP